LTNCAILVKTISLASLDGHFRRVAPEVTVGREVDPEVLLAESGLSETAIDEVREIVDRLAHREAWEMLKVFIRRMGEALQSHGTHGAALAHALGVAQDVFGKERSISELAAQFGVSKQAVGNLSSRLAPHLGGLYRPACPRTIIRPDEEGEWLTTGELRMELGLGVDAARRMEVRTAKNARGQVFYEKGSAVAAIERRALDAARENLAKHGDDEGRRSRAKDGVQRQFFEDRRAEILDRKTLN